MTRSDRLPRGRRVLVAASTGGHLLQAHMLGQFLDFRDDSTWVTFENEQSRHLLSATSHHFLPYIPPRGLREAALAFIPLLKLLKSTDVDAVMSTGAAIAVPAAIAARRCAIPFFYVESISRTLGPSASGRMVSAMPWVNTFTQHERWRDSRWRYDASVLDQLAVVPRRPPRPKTDGKTRIFVSLGTIRPYRFDRLVDGVCRLLNSGDHEVVWQLGTTLRQDLPGRVEASLPGPEMHALFEWCDVLISHAGVGTALEALARGTNTILVPRRAEHNEHIDDHQEQIATLLADRGLARAREADRLSITDLIT
ncbi:glycosyltransferase [Modestobacter sp. URMC 112]